MMDLKRMRFLMNRLPMARLRVDRAMARATRTTALLTGMPRGGGISDPVGSGVEMLELAREQYRALREELAAMQREAEPLIARLDDSLEETVMRMRYLERLSVREIAYRLNYSERHIFRVAASAEKKVEAEG